VFWPIHIIDIPEYISVKLEMIGLQVDTSFTLTFHYIMA